MKISKHFTSEEAQRTSIKGIDNTPTREALDRIRLLAEKLDIIRARWGAIHVNSWYRNFHVNSRVGGSASSQHLAGDAVDFVFDDPMTVVKAYAWIIANAELCVYNQIILYFTADGRPNFIHFAQAPEGGYSKKQVFICEQIADGGRRYTQIIP